MWLWPGPGPHQAAAAQEPELPPIPAQAPPAPAVLHPQAATTPALAARMTTPVGPTGLEPLPSGGWRLRLAPHVSGLPPAAGPALDELARRLAGQPQGRVTIIAQASAPADDVSASRRLSLARGIAVKEALAAGGLSPTRIDIRPAGRTEEGLDAVDVLPPDLAPSRGGR
jgi:hypothetical protein